MVLKDNNALVLTADPTIQNMAQESGLIDLYASIIHVSLHLDRDERLKILIEKI
jgi:hypothetical protein